jgi:hypothetical protein
LEEKETVDFVTLTFAEVPRKIALLRKLSSKASSERRGSTEPARFWR